MNRIFSVIWNHSLSAWVVASEHACRHGKRTSVGAVQTPEQKGPLRALALAIALILAPVGAFAADLPTGGQVVLGSGQILTPDQQQMIVNQSSNKLAIDWQSFNIGADKKVTFVQPGKDSVALNRVVGSDGSKIMGQLNANGQVFLVNPNGVLFAKGASVDVGGLVASTLDISNSDFAAGNYKFEGNGSNASVVNQGSIKAADGGAVALLGGTVSNQGVIAAKLGTVALAAGNKVTLDFAGDGLLNVQVDEATKNALVENKQLIQANGGQVIMTAKASDALLQTVVNNTGVIEAQTLGEKGGKIVLLGGFDGGTVQVAGTLDASAPVAGNGGFIETSGAHVKVADTAKITTAAAKGKTGKWLIDPVDFTVAASGGDMTGATITNNLKTNNVEIQSNNGAAGTQGNIYVNDSITWNANTLTFTAQNNISINKELFGSGAATLVLQYGQGALAAGNTSSVSVKAPVNLAAGKHFSTKQGSNGAQVDYTVITSLGAAGSVTRTDLQGINGGLSGNYALGGNIDASATSGWNNGLGFSSLGQISQFTGTFDGLGHVVSNLYINSPASFNGLFGIQNGTLRNIGLVGSRTTGDYAGSLVGYNQGRVENSFATAAHVSSPSYGGALVGWNEGVVTGSYASGTVSADQIAGGLVGVNLAEISNSYSLSTVKSLYGDAGGFAGYNGSVVSNVYSTGSVTGGGGLGGLLGWNEGLVSNAYSTGSVTGVTVGGSVGSNYGTLINVYYNSTVNSGVPGVGAGVGTAVGLTTSAMQQTSSFAGFTFSNTPGASGNAWVMVNADSTGINSGLGGTLPMLASEYATTITNAHQLQLMAMDLNASYALGRDIAAGTTAGSGDVWNGSFIPVGTKGVRAFSGVLDGKGHVINNLNINLPGLDAVGLFGVIGDTGVVRNLGLVSGNVVGLSDVGALAGMSTGTIQGSFSSAAVTGDSYVGGLVGWMRGGQLSDAYASGAVAATDTVGGLVGRLDGGRIDRSLATGRVSGTTTVWTGGLVGGSSGGVITASFWDTLTTGQSVGLKTFNPSAAQVTGLTTAQLQDAATLRNAGWDLSNTWIVYDGKSGPLLRSFMTALTISAGNVSKTYDGLAYTVSAPGQTISDPLVLGSLVAGGTAQGAINAGDYSIQLSGLYSTSQQGYAIDYVDGTLAVDKRVVTLTGASVADKVYDGTALADFSSGTANGILVADIGRLTFNGAFASPNAGTGIQVNIATGGAAAGNYSVSTATPLTATISAKALTLSGLSVDSKTYDGNATATLSGGVLSGLVSGETLGFSGAVGQFDNANAGIAKTVLLSGATLSDGAGLASNYSLTAPLGLTGTITPKALTVTGLSATNKVYDGTTAANVTGGILNGLVAGEQLTLTKTGQFATQNAANGQNVQVNVTLGDASGLASNYSLDPLAINPVTANIQQKLVSVSGLTANKVYDGDTFVTFTGAVISGLVGTDEVVMRLTGNFADKNAGTGKIATMGPVYFTSSNVPSSNYVYLIPQTIVGTIAKAVISSISGMTADSKVYDGNAWASLRADAATINGVVAGDDVFLTSASGQFSDKNAGNDKAVAISNIALGGIDLGNYSVATNTATATASITPKTVTLTGVTAADKVYDGTRSVLLAGGSLLGLVSGETLGYAWSGQFDDSNAGAAKTVTLGASLFDGTGLASNYNLVTPANVTANIARKALTVTGVTADGKVYDGSTAATLNGGTLNGLVGSETLTVGGLTGVFDNQNVGTGKTVSISGVTLGDGTGLASNYAVSNPSSVTAAITAKALTLTGVSANGKVYDGSTAATLNGGTLNGLVGSETLTVGGLTGVFDNQNVGTGKTVSISG
ncbi:YDG domain-containing protein, partial [Pseudomonas sp. Marseille-Q1929]|uniref:YDG domain-containing protein n=1 Tax=Pseudomonas sp. Marseille-Q1929 TaxID=2730402 RepID=UPI001A90920D